VLTIQTAVPRQELKEFVRVFAERDVACAGEGLKQPDVAQLEHIWAFDFGDSARIDYANGQTKLVPRIHVVGSQTAHSSFAHFHGHHFGFGIFLWPLASWQLFRIPPAALAHENGDGRDLFGKGIQTLWLRLAESHTFQQRVKVAEDYLMPFAINAKVQTTIMQSAQHALRHDGATRIDELANHSGLSVRQYERRFIEEIGFSPKLFTRITRFQTALDAKRMAPQRSWMSVAHEFGYFDQMHLVKDFRSLGGEIPSEMIQQGRDFRPWSVSH
jgi:AraC-like DNA-binding protein